MRSSATRGTFAAALALVACASPRVPAPVVAPTVTQMKQGWRSSRPALPPGVDFVPPRVSESVLPNGVTVLVIEQHRLPLISVRVVSHWGSSSVPPSQAGLPRMTLAAMAAGPSAHGAKELAQAFADLGGSLRIEVKPDFAAIGVDALTADAARSVALLAEMVQHAPFEERDFSHLRDEALGDLRRYLASPSNRAEVVLRRRVYGAASSYAAPEYGTLESVARLTSASLADFHHRAWQPDQIAVVVVGDVATEEAKRLLTLSFGSQRATGQKGMAPSPALQDPSSRAVVLVDVPAQQARLAVGHLGIPSDGADRAAVGVMNDILAGTAVSRLNVSLRVNKGYTYNVRSTFTEAVKPGLFFLRGGVGVDKVVPTLQEIVHEIERLRAEPPAKDEVELAKNRECVRVEKRMETDADLASLTAETWGLRLPADHWASWLASVRSVSAMEISAVAKRSLTPDHLQLVVVGPAAKLRAVLETSQLGALDLE
jgi:zinc protease